MSFSLPSAKFSWLYSLFFLHSNAHHGPHIPAFLDRILSRVTLILQGVLPSFLTYSSPAPLPKTRTAHIPDFPNELLLEIFPYLPLKSLVAARGVCRKWHQLVPCADLLPARRDLFNFYLRVVHSPHFELTRPWALANLRHFDRQAFVDDLLKQHHYLPESFRLWILEWPARAVVGCSWPGLPDEYSSVRVSVGVERAQGWNWLGQMPATVSTLKLQHETSHELVPGIFIWSGGGDGSVWLMLDEREYLRDKVYCIEETGILRGIEGAEFDSIYSSWLEWQENKWEETEKVCQDLTEANLDEYYCEEDRLPGLPSSAPLWPFGYGRRPLITWEQREEVLS